MGGLKWFFCVKGLNQRAGMMFPGTGLVLMMGNLVAVMSDNIFALQAQFIQKPLIDIHNSVVIVNNKDVFLDQLIEYGFIPGPGFLKFLIGQFMQRGKPRNFPEKLGR